MQNGPSPRSQVGALISALFSACCMLQTLWLGLIVPVISVSQHPISLQCCLYITKATAEDTVEASKRIPRSLLWSTTANKILCIIVAILIGLTAGDVNALFAGPLGASGHPVGSIVQLTFNAARKHKALASAPFGLIAPIVVMCCVNTTAAASRMVFSFVRDDRNPYVRKVMAPVSVLTLNCLNTSR